MGQSYIRLFHLALAGFTAELKSDLIGLFYSCCPYGMAAGLQSPGGIYRQTAAQGPSPSSMAFPPWPFSTKPRSSMAKISAMVKQSCTSADIHLSGLNTGLGKGSAPSMDGGIQGGQVAAVVQGQGIAGLGAAHDLDRSVGEPASGLGGSQNHHRCAIGYGRSMSSTLTGDRLP